MKISIYVLILLVVGAITIGNVMAATFNEDVFVNGILKVQGSTGTMVVQKTGGPSAITVQNVGGYSTMKWLDMDTNQEMQIRLIDNGQRLDFQNINPVNGAAISINMNNNRVGIGQLNPAEKFDVSGNIHLTGDLKLDSGKKILGAGAITIKPNGSICIGSSCP